MFSYILEILKQLLSFDKAGCTLDQYISSKNPQTSEEVESLIREYDSLYSSRSVFERYY